MGAINPLLAYSRHWFTHTALRISDAASLPRNAETIDAVEAVRPGFAHCLRQVAVVHLSSPDRELVHRALAVLASLGTVHDMALLEPLIVVPDTWLAGAAKAALFEIRARAV